MGKVGNNELLKFYNLQTKIDDVDFGDGLTLMFEIDPRIAQEVFPENPDKCDSNNGISNEWTRMVCNTGYFEKK
jgi:hypothetical protein